MDSKFGHTHNQVKAASVSRNETASTVKDISSDLFLITILKLNFNFSSFFWFYLEYESYKQHSNLPVSAVYQMCNHAYNIHLTLNGSKSPSSTHHLEPFDKNSRPKVTIIIKFTTLCCLQNSFNNWSQTLLLIQLTQKEYRLWTNNLL